MLRRSHRPSPQVSDFELGVAAVLLLIGVVLATLIIPAFA